MTHGGQFLDEHELSELLLDAASSEWFKDHGGFSSSKIKARKRAALNVLIDDDRARYQAGATRDPRVRQVLAAYMETVWLQNNPVAALTEALEGERRPRGRPRNTPEDELEFLIRAELELLRGKSAIAAVACAGGDPDGAHEYSQRRRYKAPKALRREARIIACQQREAELSQRSKSGDCEAARALGQLQNKMYPSAANGSQTKKV